MRWMLISSVSFALAAPACEKFDAPPVPSLPDANGGQLADPAAPVVVAFSKPIKPETLKLEIARDITDVEGNLGDESGDPNGALSTLFTHDPEDGDTGGTSELSPDGVTLRITPSTALPITPRLVLLVEPGLEDLAGTATHARRRVVFGYDVKLTCTKPSAILTAGKYFYLLDVKNPLTTQVQLLVSLRVAPNGEIVGQFTRAKRNPDAARCPMPCKSTEACRLLPAPACVIPSERAGTVDEYPDYVADSAPPTGYSFTVHGCAEDAADGTASFVNLPVDVDVSSPMVTLRNTRFASTFRADPAGVVRGTGAITADDVLIGQISSGRGEGGISARRIPDDVAGVPDPPP